MGKISILQLIRESYPQYDKDKASALVVCKNVYVNGELCTDTKQVFDKNAVVEISFPKYVSRGGFKLEKALETFDVSVEGKVMLDAGSSTGGFSDCLLQNGAKAVHCVDVGYNLLDFKIRNNPNSFVHEKTNIMAITELDPDCDAAVADLSFRSIRGAAEHILSLTKERWLIALIKPQFEVPKWQVDFDGVIKDDVLMKQTLENVYDILSQEKIGIADAVVSPIKGHKGNTEFLALIKDKDDSCLSLDSFLEKCNIG